MYYFKFNIPKNADGSRVSYSPGWHGTMPFCPHENTTVLLYDDKRGFGVACNEDDYTPPEIVVLPEAAAMALINSAKDEDGVYFGDKLRYRWDEEVLDG